MGTSKRPLHTVAWARFFVLVIVCIATHSEAAVLRGSSDASNHKKSPLRRVISMLQMMSKKVEEEKEHNEKLFDDFMCYCKKTTTDLQKSVDVQTEKLPQIEASIEETSALEEQLKQELEAHQSDRAAATKAIQEAQEMRNHESEVFSKTSAEAQGNLDAVKNAIGELEAGISQAAFLQTPSADMIQKLTVNDQFSSKYNIEALSNFLQEGQGTRDVGEIIGILKQMHDDMAEDLEEMKAQEESSASAFEALNEAKNKEVGASTGAIETKQVRYGDAKVALVSAQKDHEDTTDGLARDTSLLAQVEEECKQRRADNALLMKQIAEEQKALAETIKMLNDDDSAELFRKTMASSVDSYRSAKSAGASPASFLQVASKQHQPEQQAVKLLQQTSAQHPEDPQLALLAHNAKKAARHGGKGDGFAKINKLIDNMVDLLEKAQQDDSQKKMMCGSQIAQESNRKDELDNSIKSEGAEIENVQEQLQVLSGEIDTMHAGIKTLDAQVAQATSIRQAENAEHQEMVASSNAAVELLDMAKNRLNKFYNPKLYEPADTPQSEEDLQIGVNAFVETSYRKETEASSGVIEMINQIEEDLKREMTEAKVSEEHAQAEYEKFMADAKNKYATDGMTIAEKSSIKAELESKTNLMVENKAEDSKQMAEVTIVLNNLHQDCDWLLQNFDTRLKARDAEIEAMKKAKAVLAGADYSLAQTKNR